MSQSAHDQIKKDIQANKILIYMKGTPEAPQCGFSAATIQLFQSFGVSFATRDVISNPELRQSVPEISNWPTFPQVFIGGKLIGGCDIVHEMHERGELEPMVREALKSFVLIQADVTETNETSSALKKKFNVYGPPAMLFFASNGEERQALRAYGYRTPDEFLAILKKL